MGQGNNFILSLDMMEDLCGCVNNFSLTMTSVAPAGIVANFTITGSADLEIPPSFQSNGTNLYFAPEETFISFNYVVSLTTIQGASQTSSGTFIIYRG